MPNDAITPFILAVPQADLEDLNRLIDQTRWPDAETVELMWPCIWIASGLLVVRELRTSALSENVNTAFKNRPDDRNALPVCNAIRFNLN